MYGDITPNTERVIVEFINGKDVHPIALDYTTNMVSI
jgi:hypothetical protein